MAEQLGAGLAARPAARVRALEAPLGLVESPDPESSYAPVAKPVPTTGRPSSRVPRRSRPPRSAQPDPRVDAAFQPATGDPEGAEAADLEVRPSMLRRQRQWPPPDRAVRLERSEGPELGDPEFMQCDAPDGRRTVRSVAGCAAKASCIDAIASPPTRDRHGGARAKADVARCRSKRGRRSSGTLHRRAARRIDVGGRLLEAASISGSRRSARANSGSSAEASGGKAASSSRTVASAAIETEG